MKIFFRLIFLLLLGVSFLIYFPFISKAAAYNTDSSSSTITDTEVDRFVYGDEFLSGHSTPNAVLILNPYGYNDLRSQYRAKSDENGNFKLYIPISPPAGQTLTLDTLNSDGKTLDTDKVYVFNSSYHFLQPIYDSDNQLIGTTVKNTKVEVIKDGQVIASGMFDYQIKLQLPKLTAGTFLTVKFTTGDNIDLIQKVVQPKKVTLSPITKWSSYIKGITAIPNAKIIFYHSEWLGNPPTIDKSLSADVVGNFKLEFDNTVSSDNLNNDTLEVMEPVYDNVIFKQTITLSPTAPKINQITQLSTEINGTATPGSSIKILNGNNDVIGEGTTDENGNYSLPVKSLIGGDLITVQSYMLNSNEIDQSQTDVVKKAILTLKSVNIDNKTINPRSPVKIEVEFNDQYSPGLGWVNLSYQAGDSRNMVFLSYNSITGKWEGYAYPGWGAGKWQLSELDAFDSAGNHFSFFREQNGLLQNGDYTVQPIVDKVTDQSTNITGIVEAFSTITAKVGPTELGSTKADQSGNFVLSIPVQKAGTNIMVTVTDKAGNDIEEMGRIVNDGALTVNEVTDQSTSITGKAEPGTKIDVMIMESLLGSGFRTMVKTLDPVITKDDGTFTVPIELQPAGRIIVVNVTDGSGYFSEQKEVTVKDVTPPSAPRVNEVTDQSTSITGKSEAGTTVTIKNGSTELGPIIMDSDGNFILSIPAQKAGTILTVTATDSAGNISDERKITVKAGPVKEAPTIIVSGATSPNRPEVNEIADKSTSITGTATAGSTITVKLGNSVLGTAVTKNDGTFSVSIIPQKAGTKLMVTASDNAGNVSDAEKVTVIDATAPSAPVVNEVTDQSIIVTGTAEADSIIELKAGTSLLGMTITNKKGDFTLTIPVQKAGTVITVTATDRTGNISEPKEVTVKGAAQPSVPTIEGNGWVSISGKWYYSKNGEKITGWLLYKNKWYYLDKRNGAMVTGWLLNGKDWYYLNNDGSMATGWLYTGSKWFYLYNSGKMAHDTKIGSYRIGHNGVWIR